MKIGEGFFRRSRWLERLARPGWVTKLTRLLQLAQLAPPARPARPVRTARTARPARTAQPGSKEAIEPHGRPVPSAPSTRFSVARALHLAGLAAALVWAAPAVAADHVLVMTISAYPRNPLQGVTHDAGNALQLANKLGYDTSAAVVLKDQQLTGAGMRAAFTALIARVQRNDRVFVYYSGHGYSISQQGGCGQGLVAQDETLIPTAELSSQLDGIKALVSDALVIFDACFSGGNRDLTVTRAFDGGAATAELPLQAKVWTPRGGERCELPTNELAKSWEPPDLQQVTRALLFPKANFTFLAAATEREVALDDRERGGLATLGLLQCADEGVAGTNGPVTALELASCAQGHIARNVQGINARLQTKAYLPHQLTVYGNGDRLFEVRPKAAAAGSPSAASAIASAAPRDGRAEGVIGAFKKFVANSNGNWGLSVEPSARDAPVGTAVRLRVRTSQPGYVQLLYVGSDRREISRIWPAEGQTRRFDASDGELPIGLTLSAPAGANTLMVVLSREPLDLAPVLVGGTAAAAPAVLQQLGCAFVRQRNIVVKEDAGPPGPCASTASPGGGSPAPGGVDGYTARIVTVVGTTAR